MRLAVLSLTGCGGCDLALARAMLRLQIQPEYFKLLVENREPPLTIDMLIVTGACFNRECLETVKRFALGARKSILVGCCALNCGVYARSGVCKPPSTLLKHSLRVPGCPPHPTLIESILERVVVHEA